VRQAQGLCAPAVLERPAEARCTSVDQRNPALLDRWLAETRAVRWDYKNPVKRKRRLERQT
jgi:hypothetical protein